MTGTPLLFSVDVEDPRDDMPNGDRLPARVPMLVDVYLRLLADLRCTGTFFIVGEVARRDPDLVRNIIDQGHEIGCHSDSHVPLDRQDPASFREDLLRNREALQAAGAVDVTGYRAPCFSLTQATQWAYPILAEAGFRYSSSVVPARSALYGWPGFGTAPRMVHGLLELPISLLPSRFLRWPVGGLYFRVLPRPLLRRALRRLRKTGEAVLSYHHPYDMDVLQPYPHPAFGRWSPYGLLMRYNRQEVLPRLRLARELGFVFAPYGPYAEEQRNRLERGQGGRAL